MSKKRKRKKKANPKFPTFWRLCLKSDKLFQHRSVCISVDRAYDIGVLCGRLDYFRDPLPVPNEKALPPEQDREMLYAYCRSGNEMDPKIEAVLQRHLGTQVYQNCEAAYWKQITTMYPEVFSGATLVYRKRWGYYYPGVCAFRNPKVAIKSQYGYKNTSDVLIGFRGKELDTCPEGVVAKPIKIELSVPLPISEEKLDLL